MLGSTDSLRRALKTARHDENRLPRAFARAVPRALKAVTRDAHPPPFNVHPGTTASAAMSDDRPI